MRRVSNVEAASDPAVRLAGAVGGCRTEDCEHTRSETSLREEEEIERGDTDVDDRKHALDAVRLHSAKDKLGLVRLDRLLKRRRLVEPARVERLVDRRIADVELGRLCYLLVRRGKEEKESSSQRA